jgi:hypothetical protein
MLRVCSKVMNEFKSKCLIGLDWANDWNRDEIKNENAAFAN